MLVIGMPRFSHASGVNAMPQRFGAGKGKSARAVYCDVAPSRGAPGKRIRVAQRYPVMRATRSGAPIAPSGRAALDTAASTTGEPLPESMRAHLGAALGTDLSGVRVHTGGESAQAADAIGARAYTTGQDIHFGAGEYAPSSPGGQELIAHEVAHTVQQVDATPAAQAKPQVSAPGDACEREADDFARHVARFDLNAGEPNALSRGDLPAVTRGSTSGVVARQPKEEAPVVASAEGFVRESVMHTLSIEIPELRGRAEQLAREETPWPRFKRMVIGSHEWDDPVRRAVYVRYFSQALHSYSSEGQAPNMDDVINDVVEVEIEFWETRNDVGADGEAAVREDETETNGGGFAAGFAAGVEGGTAAPGGVHDDAGGAQGAGPGDGGLGFETPQMTGSGLVVFYDSMQRLSYAKTIKQTSTQAVIEIGEAAKLGDLARSEQVARNASASRNYQRHVTQQRVTPGARMMSEMLEQDRSWAAMNSRALEQLHKDGVTNPSPYQVHDRIARSSGKTNRTVLRLAKVGAWAGPISVATSGFVSGYAIADAPPEERGRVVAEEAGGAAGGAVGTVLGGTAAATAIGFLLGSNPAGWIVIGGSLIGSAIGGATGSKAGRGLGGKAFDAARDMAEATEFMGEYIGDEIYDESRRDQCQSEFAPPDLCAGVDSNYAFEKRIGYDPDHLDD